MNNFVEIDGGKSLINLNNVTNIAFKNNRIIFNFSNNIEINTRRGIQVIADYRYDDYSNDDEFNKNAEKLVRKLEQSGFISPVNVGYDHHWVNPKHITFINIDKRKKRLIFNLANSVTKPVEGDAIMLVNDFVFWTHDTDAELDLSISAVFTTLN